MVEPSRDRGLFSPFPSTSSPPVDTDHFRQALREFNDKRLAHKLSPQGWDVIDAKDRSWIYDRAQRLKQDAAIRAKVAKAAREWK
ncbi:MAG: hypothetical protein JO356_02760 [Acidobacteria bacterium]|nr:hypothetical protein [Acidobacteriota bacterium]